MLSLAHLCSSLSVLTFTSNDALSPILYWSYRGDLFSSLRLAFSHLSQLEGLTFLIAHRWKEISFLWVLTHWHRQYSSVTFDQGGLKCTDWQRHVSLLILFLSYVNYIFFVKNKRRNCNNACSHAHKYTFPSFFYRFTYSLQKMFRSFREIKS